MRQRSGKYICLKCRGRFPAGKLSEKIQHEGKCDGKKRKRYFTEIECDGKEDYPVRFAIPHQWVNALAEGQELKSGEMFS